MTVDLSKYGISSEENAGAVDLSKYGIEPPESVEPTNTGISAAEMVGGIADTVAGTGLGIAGFFGGLARRFGALGSTMSLQDLDLLGKVVGTAAKPDPIINVYDNPPTLPTGLVMPAGSKGGITADSDYFKQRNWQQFLAQVKAGETAVNNQLVPTKTIRGTKAVAEHAERMGDETAAAIADMYKLKTAVGARVVNSMGEIIHELVMPLRETTDELKKSYPRFGSALEALIELQAFHYFGTGTKSGIKELRVEREFKRIKKAVDDYQKGKISKEEVGKKIDENLDNIEKPEKSGAARSTAYSSISDKQAWKEFFMDMDSEGRGPAPPPPPIDRVRKAAEERQAKMDEGEPRQPNTAERTRLAKIFERRNRRLAEEKEKKAAEEKAAKKAQIEEKKAREEKRQAEAKRASEESKKSVSRAKQREKDLEKAAKDPTEFEKIREDTKRKIEEQRKAAEKPVPKGKKPEVVERVNRRKVDRLQKKLGQLEDIHRKNQETLGVLEPKDYLVTPERPAPKVAEPKPTPVEKRTKPIEEKKDALPRKEEKKAEAQEESKIDKAWRELKESKEDKQVEKLWEEIGERNKIPLEKRSKSFEEETQAIRTKIDEIKDSPEYRKLSDAWFELYQKKEKVKTKKELGEQRKLAEESRDRWDKETIEEVESPVHGTDIDKLGEILSDGLKPGSALDLTKEKGWSIEYPIQVVVPLARKGRKIEHNNFYNSANRSAPMKVFIDLSQYDVKFGKKVKKDVAKLQEEYPEVKFKFKKEKEEVLAADEYYHSPSIKRQLEAEKSIYSKHTFVEKGDDPTHYIGKSKDVERIELPAEPRIVSLDDIAAEYGKKIGKSKQSVLRNNDRLSDTLNFAWEKGYDLVDGGTQFRVVNPKLNRTKVGSVKGKERSTLTGAKVQKIPGVSKTSSGKVVGHKLPVKKKSPSVRKPTTVEEKVDKALEEVEKKPGIILRKKKAEPPPVEPPAPAPVVVKKKGGRKYKKVTHEEATKPQAFDIERMPPWYQKELEGLYREKDLRNADPATLNAKELATKQIFEHPDYLNETGPAQISGRGTDLTTNQMIQRLREDYNKSVSDRAKIDKKIVEKEKADVVPEGIQRIDPETGRKPGTKPAEPKVEVTAKDALEGLEIMQSGLAELLGDKSRFPKATNKAAKALEIKEKARLKKQKRAMRVIEKELADIAKKGARKVINAESLLEKIVEKTIAKERAGKGKVSERPKTLDFDSTLYSGVDITELFKRRKGKKFVPVYGNPVENAFKLQDSLRGRKPVKDVSTSVEGIADVSRVNTPQAPEKLPDIVTEFSLEKKNLLPTLLKDIANQNPTRTMIYELTQNSLDAFEGKQKGLKRRIDIRIDTSVPGRGARIDFIDNGSGMTPQEVQTFFLVGGSEGKSGTTTRGGYGLAKIALLLTPKRVRLTTFKDGIKTVVSASREDIYSGKIVISPERFAKPGTPGYLKTGTIFEAQMPKKFQGIPMDKNDWRRAIDNVLEGTWANVHFNVKEKTIFEPVFKTVTTKSPSSLASTPKRIKGDGFSLDGSDVAVHFVKVEPYGTDYFSPGKFDVKSIITNKGLILDVRVPPLSMHTQPDFKIVVDFEKTSTVRDPKYPFLKNRTELSQKFHDRIDEIIKAKRLELVSEIATEKSAEFNRRYDKSPEYNGIKVIIPYDGWRFDAIKGLVDANLSVFESISAITRKFSDRLSEVGESSVDFHLTLDPSVYGYKTNKNVVGRDIYAINPFALNRQNAEAMGFQRAVEQGADVNRLKADMMTHALYHEYTHKAVSGHYESFTSELGRIVGALGHESLAEIAKDFRRYYEKFDKTIESIDRDLQSLQESGLRSQADPLRVSNKGFGAKDEGGLSKVGERGETVGLDPNTLYSGVPLSEYKKIIGKLFPREKITTGSGYVLTPRQVEKIKNLTNRGVNLNTVQDALIRSGMGKREAAAALELFKVEPELKGKTGDTYVKGSKASFEGRWEPEHPEFGKIASQRKGKKGRPKPPIYEKIRDSLIKFSEEIGDIPRSTSPLKTAPRVFERMGKDIVDTFYHQIAEAKEVMVDKLEEFRGQNKNIRKDKGLSRGSAVRIGTYLIAKRSPRGKTTIEKMGKKVPVLTEAEMRAASLIENQFKRLYDEVNQARVQAGLEPFTKVKDYMTFVHDISIFDRLEIPWRNKPMEALNRILDDVHPTATGFRYGKRASDSLIIPLETNVFRVLDKYGSSAIKHSTLSPTISLLREHLRGFKDPKTGKVWRLENHSPRAYTWLQKWLDNETGVVPSSDFVPAYVERGAMRMSKNLVASILGGSLRTVIIQPTAAIINAAITNPMASFKALEYFKSRKVRRMVREKSNLKLREYDIIQSELADVILSKKPLEIHDWLTKKSLEGVRVTDMFTAGYSWYANYLEAINTMKLGERAAIRRANLKTVKTQGSAASHDLPPIQRGKMGRALTLFQTFNINQFGAIINDIAGFGRLEKMSPKQRIQRTLAFISMVEMANTIFEKGMDMESPFPAPFLAFVDSLSEEKGFDQATEKMLREFAEFIPIVGGSIKFGSGFGGPLADKIYKTMELYRRAEGREFSKKEKEYRDSLFYALAGVHGSGQVRRYQKGREKGYGHVKSALGVKYGKSQKKGGSSRGRSRTRSRTRSR